MSYLKNEIKLIASDLDGTLLNSKKEITDYNKKILSELIHNRNIEFIISTGRPFESIVHYNEILNNNNDSIIFNGASIYDNNGNILHKKIIDEKASESIIKLLKNYKVCIHVYNDGKYIVSDKDFPIKSYVQMEHIVNIIYGLGNIDNYQFSKILILGEMDILNFLKKEIDSNFNIHSCFSGNRFLEIVSKDANKGNALKWICENKGIDISNTIAFGDYFNDIEMLEYAGIGVAMGNSVDELKAKANYTTLSNDEDGFGKFLEKFFEL